MMDYAAIISAIGAAVGGIIGVLGKHLYDRNKQAADEKLATKKLAMEECNAEDHRADTWAERMIAALRNDVEVLRAEMNQLRADHLNCERIAAGLRAEIDVLRKRVVANE
jgi:hypothetical protein